jgi:two-component system, cell cycle sensor histidine kinase and response regulator CckA
MVRRFIETYHKPAIIAGLAVILALFGLLDTSLVSASYDRTLGWLVGHSPLTNSPVVLVYIDIDAPLDANQRPGEPLSHALHAKLVQRLTRAGAKAIVFDIIFDGPVKDAAADAAFAEAMRASSRVILAEELDSSTHSTSDTPGLRRDKIVPPNPVFSNVAAGLGLAKFTVDHDLVVRRFFPGHPSQNEPSLTWVTAEFLKLSSIEDDTLRKGRGWLRYYGPPVSIPHVSYSDALAPGATSDEFFSGKIVIIGARPVAGGILERKDEFLNPISSWWAQYVLMPAVEVHATQMLNLVRGDWLRRLPEPVEAWCLILSAVFFTALLFRFRPLPATGIALVSEGLVLVVCSVAVTAENIWFPWLIVSAFQIPSALLGSVAFHSLEWYRIRRRLEAARRQAEAKIREQAALIDKAQDAILVGDLSGQVVYANASAERLYGWTAAELQRDGAVQQLFAPVAEKLAEIRRVVSESGEWMGELEQATRSGGRIIVESRWTLIKNELQEASSFLLINTDITEKKRLEAQFLRNQRMDTIGALAGGMAHDLNNALSPILMGIQLIRRKAQDEETQEMLSVMEANTHRGADMVRQVLTFSRGSEGERELLNVGSIMREMEHIARQTLPKKISINTMVPSDLWPVFGNSTQLHQVLLNLCVNARDAMPGGGELTLAADNLELNSGEAEQIPNARAGQYVMLLVSDTGTGIAPEALPRIFEPFYTTKEPGKGTGLGLSTIARIVRNHGGFVSVKSELGVGTMFEVHLPKAMDAGSRRPDAAVVNVPRAHGELILLVEDDRSVREMVATGLTEHGYQVVAAASGEEALTMLSQHASDIRLVLTDLTLPAVEGAATHLLIGSRRPDLPIILMSGELESLETPATGLYAAFLPKPFRLEQLLTAVAQGLNHQVTKA